MPTSPNIPCQREAVLLPPDLHYLNVAYMAPLHERVRAAGTRSVHRQANPLNLGVHSMFAEVDQLRALFAKLVGAGEPGRIAVMPSASYGLNTAARNLAPSRGQKIIVLGDQFPSNYYPWAKACTQHGAELQIIPAPKSREKRGKEWNARLLEAIDPPTAVVALPNVHWSDGTLFDLPAVRKRTREVGAAMVVDGTQSVGVVPIDVDSLQPDALICAAYKSMLCPYGTAFAFYGPRFDSGEPLEETWLGRRNSDDFANLVNYQDQYRDLAMRYEAGGRCNFITMPMVTAALELLLEFTPTRIGEYCSALTADLGTRLSEAGFWLEAAEHRSPQLFGIRASEGIDLDQCFVRLEAAKVAVSRRGNAIRVSPHLHNTPEDIDALVAALSNTA